MDFVAIDFETANSFPQSACSVGLVRFDGDGVIGDRFYSLIKPPARYSYFHFGNVAIHGIRSSDVSDSPEFDCLWPEIKSFIGNSVLVAHNASFDMRVLRSLLEYYGIENPHFGYLCSLQISRKIWPYLESHRLTFLSEYFNLEYKAHYALDDAENCGKIFVRACSGRLSELNVLRKFLITKGIDVVYL